MSEPQTDDLAAAVRDMDTAWGMLCFDWSLGFDRRDDVEAAQEYLWAAKGRAEKALADRRASSPLLGEVR